MDKRGFEESECDGGRSLGELEGMCGGIGDGRWDGKMCGDNGDVMFCGDCERELDDEGRRMLMEKARVIGVG